jgi:DNA-binding winged helix-turn-helix (wHTH) protein
LAAGLLFPYRQFILRKDFNNRPQLRGSGLRYYFEHYCLDTDRRELCQGVEVIAIAPQVFDLLVYLIANRERVISKDELIRTIWQGRAVSDVALTTRLNAARKAIGDSGDDQRLIKTFLRKGVRFVAAVREATEPTTAIAITSYPVAGKPSLVVLPFANLSPDPAQ